MPGGGIGLRGLPWAARLAVFGPGQRHAARDAEDIGALRSIRGAVVAGGCGVRGVDIRLH